MLPFFDGVFEVIGQLGVKLHLLLCFGMYKAERFCVQCLARNDLEAVVDKLFVFLEYGTLEGLITSIGRVIEQRMANMLHMRANLVSTARFELALDQ